jgi:hypothetical protein
LSPVSGQVSSNDSVKTQPFPALSYGAWKAFGSTMKNAMAHNNLPALTRYHRLHSAITIRKDQYVVNFGFFCRKEMQFETHTSLPLRFRLGSLDQCNYLEGKQ